MAKQARKPGSQTKQHRDFPLFSSRRRHRTRGGPLQVAAQVDLVTKVDQRSEALDGIRGNAHTAVAEALVAVAVVAVAGVTAAALVEVTAAVAATVTAVVAGAAAAARVGAGVTAAAAAAALLLDGTTNAKCRNWIS